MNATCIFKGKHVVKNKGTYKLALLIIAIALIGMSCNMANIGSVFATETPTPTSTYTPTSTFTPSPTSTSTATPTNTPTATPLPTGVLTDEQADGSTLFVDYDNQYQLIIPADWLVIPLSSNEIFDILEEIAETNPAFEEIADSFLQLDPDIIRIIAVNENRKYTTSGFATNLTITAIEDKLMSSMPLDFVTGALEESLKQQGAKLVSEFEPAARNANGVEIAEFEFEQTTTTSTGASVRVRSGTLLFQSDGKLIMVQLTTQQQFAGELMPILEQIRDMIELLKPQPIK